MFVQLKSPTQTPAFLLYGDAAPLCPHSLFYMCFVVIIILQFAFLSGEASPVHLLFQVSQGEHVASKRREGVNDSLELPRESMSSREATPSAPVPSSASFLSGEAAPSASLAEESMSQREGRDHAVNRREIEKERGPGESTVLVISPGERMSSRQATPFSGRACLERRHNLPPFPRRACRNEKRDREREGSVFLVASQGERGQ